MIAGIKIENYALIVSSSIEFTSGFTVITGETGAGKSIMLDALSLLTGSRADTKAMGDKNKKTVVEASFIKNDDKVRSFLESHDIEWDENELILRREISPSGKSRGFINDTPVNLSVLSEIGEYLIDVHSQHSNSILKDSQHQTEILDAFAGNKEIKEKYREVFRNYVGLRNRIKNLREAELKLRENREFIEFRLEQLDKLKLKQGELEKLEKEFDLLNDADNIKSQLGEVFISLAGDSHSAMKRLNESFSILEKLDLSFIDELQDKEESIVGRLSALKVELRDIADTVGDYVEKIDSNPEKLEKTRTRIENIYAAIKRFKVKDEEELIALYSRLKEDFSQLNSSSEELPKMEKDLKALREILKKSADELSQSRETAAIEFSERLKQKILPLGLPNLRFEVKVKSGKLTSEGQDQVEFYCSFNKNHDLQPVNGIASGGEISRVMLGIKSLMAESMNLPTVIFDEIDTGVSGEIAHRMGLMMREMSEKIQVMSVTHLPQVAANAHWHLKVYKTDDEEKTVSHIKLLDEGERIKEIAGMLSGDSINEASLRNARALMESINKDG